MDTSNFPSILARKSPTKITSDGNPFTAGERTNKLPRFNFSSAAFLEAYSQKT
jgi:hypothetical protein